MIWCPSVHICNKFANVTAGPHCRSFHLPSSLNHSETVARNCTWFGKQTHHRALRIKTYFVCKCLPKNNSNKSCKWYPFGGAINNGRREKSSTVLLNSMQDSCTAFWRTTLWTKIRHHFRSCVECCLSSVRLGFRQPATVGWKTFQQSGTQ